MLFYLLQNILAYRAHEIMRNFLVDSCACISILIPKIVPAQE
jgi:hypothetical protein